MADNFLENHYEDYLRRKALWEKRQKAQRGTGTQQRGPGKSRQASAEELRRLEELRWQK